MIYSLVRLKRLSIRANALQDEIKELRSKKRSVESKHGMAVEHFIPFMKDYPYNVNDSHFLGRPVDFVVFEDEEVIFLEVKTGNSKLSTKQTKIKKQIEEGKVRWEEIRISANNI